MKSFSIVCMAVCVCVNSLANAAGGYVWPNWRGPAHDGKTAESISNTAALEAGRVLWRGNVGDGYATVSVVDNRLYTMGNDGRRDTVYCLDALTGEEVWSFSYDCRKGSHEGPRGTPAVYEGIVYTYSREGHVHALNSETGRMLWMVDVTGINGRAPRWGFSGSPRILGDMLLLNSGKHGLALDRRSGEVRWASPAGVSGYATAVPYGENDNRLVIFGERAAYGVNAVNGEEVWSYEWITSYNVNAADPIVVGNQVFISSGYNKGAALLDVTGDNVRVIWEHNRMRNQFSSSILWDDDTLIGIDGNTGRGELVAMEFATGNERWRAGLRFGTVLGTGDQVLVLNERGNLFLGTPGADAFLVQARSEESVLGNRCWIMPVLVNGLLYCRNEKGDLVCLDLR